MFVAFPRCNKRSSFSLNRHITLEGVRPHADLRSTLNLSVRVNCSSFATQQIPLLPVFPETGFIQAASYEGVPLFVALLNLQFSSCNDHYPVPFGDTSPR